MFEKGFCFKVKTPQTYRNSYLPSLVKKKKDEVRSLFDGKNFSIIFDETTDVNGRYILNLFGYILDNHPKLLVLLDSVELEKTNSFNIVKEVNFTIASLVRDRHQRKNFKFLITDGAAYCLKVGRMLKDDYPQLRHLVCFCHNLHLLAEEVRKINARANLFIAELKKSLVKNKTNQMIYFEETELPLIKFPIVTRWGTFIDCCSFVHKNFDKISNFIKKLNKDNYGFLYDCINDPTIKLELKCVSEKTFISASIKYLESNGLHIINQVEKMKEVASYLEDERLKNRFSQILEKNPDYSFLQTLDNIKQFPYLNATSVSVERSFSYLNLLLSDNRRNIKSENIYSYLFLRINSLSN